VVSSGLVRWEERRAEDYQAAAEALNVAGRRLRQQGLFLHYHNHDFEFQPVADDRTGFNLLLDGLDTEAVTLCVDTGWVWLAGTDPAEFLRQHSERVGMVHLRDWQEGRSVPLGGGEMDLGPIIAELPHLPPLRWVVVEQDPDSQYPAEDMRRSRAHLRDHFSF
jgi:sugar phosphate isomerase/epimerase